MRWSTVLGVFLLLTLASVDARAGLALSPAAGEYTFGTSGGTMQIFVYNPGDETGQVTLTLGGSAASIASLDASSATLSPSSYRAFLVTIGPGAGTQDLILSASMSAQSGATATVSGKLALTFSGSGSTNYVASSVANYNADVILYVVFALIILLVAYVLVRFRGRW